MEAGEECDDGNRKNGDGCDSECRIEGGWICDAVSPSVCIAVSEKLTKTDANAPVPFDRRSKGKLLTCVKSLNSCTCYKFPKAMI